MLKLAQLSMLFLSEAGNPLQIQPLNILYHIINLIILVALLRWLLYKPVKKFMDKRKAEITAVTEQNNKMTEEVAAVKKQYAGMVEEAKTQAAKMAEESTKAAKEHAESILAEANRHAKELLENAKLEAAEEKRRSLEEIKQQVAVVGVEIAKKLLGREITAKDDAEMIEQCLKEWSKE